MSQPDACEFYQRNMEKPDFVSNGADPEAWYAVLARIETLTQGELRALRRLAALHFHPDRFNSGSNGQHTEVLADINSAIDGALLALILRQS